MLFLGGEPFTSGGSKFLDQHPRFVEPTAKVFVKVAIPGFKGPLMAQVDTAAAYSTLETDVAESMGLFSRDEYPTLISTRLGTIRGQLLRLPLTLIAEEGTSLNVEATFFVSRQWRGPMFLGYTGLLDRLRIALDPLANMFFFGEGV